MRSCRRTIAVVLALLVVGVAGPAPVQGAGALGSDVSKTTEGRQRIDETVASFGAQGTYLAAADLTATRLAGGDVLVLDKRYGAEFVNGGYRVTTPKTDDAAASGPVALVAATWTLLGSQCFAALFRGAAHMDACYKRYKMSSDGDATKDYWRLDLYATMFAEGRTLDWGWVAGDRDAGPALSFVDWSPDADVWQGCGNYSLSISVAGIGGGFGATFCELNNISKSTGPVVGWFKDYWDWNIAVPTRDRDRSAAIIIGASSTQGGGSPTWGLSWNFAAH